MFNNPTTKTIFNYLSYLSLFVGAGFISGAIVHSGNATEIPKYITIGIIGVVLFSGGSLTQELITGNHKMNALGAIKFFFFSLILSIGIGMISGGTQHFTDFPMYSSFLIPAGFMLSWIAFVFKNNSGLNSKILATTVGILILCLPLYISLNGYAKKLITSECSAEISFLDVKVFASGGHTDSNCPKSITKPETINHDAMTMSRPSVVDDKSFIEYVIAHHQDAVDGSTKVLTTTQDPELRAFLNNVIKSQGGEINLLKGYYKTWFGKDYVSNVGYTTMMKFDILSGVAIDKAYVQEMLGHHSGIIDVAKMVVASDLGYKYKPEIITLSRQIIKDQEADNIILNKWLVEKYKTVQTATPSNKMTMDGDGHVGGH
jgi:uncharacterized protein (DUF305 family)